MFCRTCQECGHIQPSKPISEYKGDSWLETPCKRCKSSALDYGHEGFERGPDGKLRRIVEEDPDD